jgi:hypothetical protein
VRVPNAASLYPTHEVPKLGLDDALVTLALYLYHGMLSSREDHLGIKCAATVITVNASV